VKILLNQKMMRAIKSIITVLIFFAMLATNSCKNKNIEQLAANEYYTCSMDPQVREKHPGICPICKMDLAKTQINHNDKAVLSLSKTQVKLANIKTDTVKMEYISEEIIVAGVVKENENLSSEISSRVSGRIDKLVYKTEGEFVKKGDLLYEIYSEELEAAKKDYLIAKERVGDLVSNSINMNSILASAKNKLLLWGLSEKQILQIEKGKNLGPYTQFYSNISGTILSIDVNEGDYLNEGSTIYKIADLSSVWIESELYSNESDYAKEGAKVLVEIPWTKNDTLIGKLFFKAPLLIKGTKILPVRTEVDNSKGLLKPGMIANVKLNVKGKKAVIVNSDAVIRNDKFNAVWVQNPDGSYMKKLVTIGIENSIMIEITNGLSVGELVVSSGAYLLDSEYIFKKGHSEEMPGMTGMGN